MALSIVLNIVGGIMIFVSLALTVIILTAKWVQRYKKQPDDRGVTSNSIFVFIAASICIIMAGYSLVVAYSVYGNIGYHPVILLLITAAILMIFIGWQIYSKQLRPQSLHPSDDKSQNNENIWPPPPSSPSSTHDKSDSISGS